MKKYLLMIVAVLILSSCVKEEVNPKDEENQIEQQESARGITIDTTK